jgi:hypothetical protein
MGCALVLAVTGRGGPSGSSVSLAHESSTSRRGAVIVPARGGSTYTLMQRNLCLSGFAGCYIEWRRWLCVTTRVEVDVCTAHLNTRTTIEVAGNDAQCVELAALLARRASARAVIFGGDVNRHRSCAPDGFWTSTDSSAAQAPGLQHVYGSGVLRSPSAEVVPATHTDHDVLLVRAHLTAT